MKHNITMALTLNILVLVCNFNLNNTISVIPQSLSPQRVTECIVGNKRISIEYGSPSIRGRKIMGDLVPYNRVWIMGADRATVLKTESNLTIGDVFVPKGQYTLFALPTEKTWKLIINKQATRPCFLYSTDDEKQELGRVDMNLVHLESPVEQHTISLIRNGTGGTITLEWETIRASINFIVQ